MSQKNLAFKGIEKINDIYYCEANERETIVFTKEDKYIVKSSITEFEKNLPSSKFFKTHRSYIVNISYTKEIKKNSIILKNNIEA